MAQAHGLSLSKAPAARVVRKKKRNERRDKAWGCAGDGRRRRQPPTPGPACVVGPGTWSGCRWPPDPKGIDRLEVRDGRFEGGFIPVTFSSSPISISSSLNGNQDKRLTHTFGFPFHLSCFFLAVHRWVGARAVIGLWPVRFGAGKRKVVVFGVAEPRFAHTCRRSVVGLCISDLLSLPATEGDRFSGTAAVEPCLASIVQALSRISL